MKNGLAKEQRYSIYLHGLNRQGICVKFTSLWTSTCYFYVKNMHSSKITNSRSVVCERARLWPLCF